MATTINYQGTDIKLTSKRQGTAYPWGDKYLRQHHRIFATIGCKRIQFEYYCNEVTLKEDDLRFALYCFLSDGIAYNNAKDFEDFCNEFGYDIYNYNGMTNAESMRVYKACGRNYDKWQELCNIDIYDIANWMQEEYEL